MKIVMIGTTDILGGAAQVGWNIKQELERSGHSVSLFVADKQSDDPNVHIIPRSYIRKRLGFLLGIETMVQTDWLLKTEEFKKADIIHCHNLHGRYFNLETLKKMSQLKPVVWTLHDEWAITPHCACTMQSEDMKYGLYTCPSIETPPRLLWNNTRWLARWKTQIYQHAKLHIVVPSRWLMQRVKNTVLNKQDIQYVPNGINTGIFMQTDKQEARARLGLPKNKRLILSLADNVQDNPWKGWKYTEAVMDHYAHDSQTAFVIVGNREAKESNERTLYRGYVQDQEQLALYYSACDALLFTSVAENLPLVVLEAASCGLPVIAFDVGGVKEAIEDRASGYIAEYRNSDDLINGIDWLFSLEKAALNTVSKNAARKIRETFDLAQMTTSYIELYEKLSHPST